MEKENRIGFGDVLIYSVLLALAMKCTGLLTASWVAIYHFSLFVLIYLAVYFVIDLVIAIIDAVIKKREE
ncbi:hypothetical protein LH991_14145 [Schleiferilactobacillus harbinensis]|uniref:hypothetical protein n=1 Tax=Schleiferilactobacillus harbinensis TaxID=304207 RepID=UPI000482D92B|nr:hypothetical protein [Schleiferilactobacillus harbinensis]QFR65005.1 hypothetical protein LH991_14145 [Schleiferilactobacillus harbinensis]